MLVDTEGLLLAVLVLAADVSDPLGYLYAVSGRVGEGLPLLQEALRFMEAMGMVQWRTPLLWHLGEVYLLAGRRDDALAQTEQCLALAREHGHRGSEAWALRLLGEIASHGDHPEIPTAEVQYGAAMALASELGMRPLVAHCHLGLGMLYRRTDKHQEAREHLTTAATLYREMGMTFWLEKMETALRGAPS